MSHRSNETYEVSPIQAGMLWYATGSGADIKAPKLKSTAGPEYRKRVKRLYSRNDNTSQPYWKEPLAGFGALVPWGKETPRLAILGLPSTPIARLS